MKKFTFSLLSIAFAMTGFAQQNMTLSFTGIHNTSYVQLDSIRIMNRTQDCDTVLHWPDTLLNLTYVGIAEFDNSESRLQVFQNHPNPVANETDIAVYVPEKDQVRILVTDITGKTIITQTRQLEKGTHAFHFMPGAGKMYLFTAAGRFEKSSIKIQSIRKSKTQNPVLTYSGKTNAQNSELKSTNAWRDFVFMPGDELILAGCYDTLESGILDNPELSKDYVFQFAYDIPCPGMPTVEYGGQVYNTVLIGNQCWLKENLNIGTMIPGDDEMQNNSTIEKYCYNDDPANCDEYGALYQWDEMMQYVTQQGAQGICPDGWHLPTDEEWKTLEGTVDSQYPVGDPEWDNTGWRGLDAGKNLKSTSGWNNNGNGTDLYGFGALPGGFRYSNGSFFSIGFGYWWSSSENSGTYAWSRYLVHDYDLSLRNIYSKGLGFSVRCLRD